MMFWICFNVFAAIFNWVCYFHAGHELMNLICAVVSTTITVMLLLGAAD